VLGVVRLSFLGGAGTVTGSAFLFEWEDTRLLVDCGLVQGREAEQAGAQDLPLDPATLDFVLITHSHIDHIGRLPLLARDPNFSCRVLATLATRDLAGIMLPDSGHIQELEAVWENKDRRRRGEPAVDPLYTAAEAAAAADLIEGVSYGEPIDLADGLACRFMDAGHILGSASIKLYFGRGGSAATVVISGDVGQRRQPLIRDPWPPDEADYLLLESTYGGRRHRAFQGVRDSLAEIIEATCGQGGNLVIPAFALGRTQEVLYLFNELFKDRGVRQAPVYLDSPLAISATGIFRRHTECFDTDALDLVLSGDDPLSFGNLHLCRTTDESKALNDKRGAIILSASGMCTAGRIKHHLLHNLGRPESTVLFVGFQAEGTLGRRLVDGAAAVRIFGVEVPVRARIESIGALSAHADEAGLLEWAGHIRRPPRTAFLVHGEPEAAAALAARLRDDMDWTAVVPRRGETIVLRP